MKVQIRRTSYKHSYLKKGRVYTVIYPTASRYENGKLQAFSFMTELKGK